jgi:predicted Zn-dependent peptidase
MKFIYRYIGVISFLIYLPVNGQLKADSTNFPDSTIIDESIIHGVLDNGFTYYIKPLPGTNQEIKMNLTVKAGSFYEKANELDFAHAIEHLAFRETENFPQGLAGNVNLLSNLGMESRDLKGMTGGFKTTYYFKPSKHRNTIKTGILWFKDILYGLDLSEKNVDRERGVLLQEYLNKQPEKTGGNPLDLLESKLFPWAGDRTNFVKHNKNFPFSDLGKFYEKWYLPERAALSIVGNIENTDQLRDLIEKHFTKEKPDISRTEKPGPLNRYLMTGPQYAAIHSGPLQTTGSMEKAVDIYLFYRDRVSKLKQGTKEGIGQKLITQVVTGILNRRFDEDSMSYGNNTHCYSTHTSYFDNLHKGRPPYAFKVMIKSELHWEREALQKCIRMLKQLKKYGLREAELTRAKNEILKNYPAGSTETSGYWSAGISNHFVFSEPLWENKNSYIRSFIKNLKLKDTREVIDNLISGMPEDIGVIFPEGYKTVSGGEVITRKWISEAGKESVSPYRIPDIKMPLSEKEKEALSIGEPKSVSDGVLGSREYILKNGLKLILKPEKNSGSKDILVRGFSSRGASCFPEEDVDSAKFSPSLVGNSGIGRLDKFGLNLLYKSTSSLKTGFRPYVNYDEAGMEAMVNRDELEILMQLVYLYFTRPRKDSLAFKQWRKEQMDFTKTSINPVNNLIDDLNELIKDDAAGLHGSKRIMALEEVDFHKAFELYRQIFSSPEDFTFIVTGNFEEGRLLPDLKKYLGNIPGGDFADCREAVNGNLDPGPVFKNKSSYGPEDADSGFYALGYVKTRDKIDSWREKFKVRVLGEVANSLLYRLRTEDGLSLYYFSAGGSFNPPLDRYEIEFRLNCTGGELPSVKNRTNEVIQDLKNGNFSVEQLKSKVENIASGYREGNINWIRWQNELIYRYHKYNEPIVEADEIREFLSSLTVKDIQETANRYFKDEYKYELKSERTE